MDQVSIMLRAIDPITKKEHNQELSIALKLSRSIMICVGGLSAAIAFVELDSSIGHSTISVLAKRLRAEHDIEFNILQKVAARLDRGASGMSCRTEMLADALTIHLHYLDHLDNVESYDEWAQGVQRAVTFVEFAIQCSPADGNLWARLAMLRQATVFQPDETARLMRRSVELSPAQINVILARFEVWKAMERIASTLPQEDVTSDIFNLVAFGRIRDIKLAFSRLGRQLKMHVRQQIQALGDARSKHLHASGIRI